MVPLGRPEAPTHYKKSVGTGPKWAKVAQKTMLSGPLPDVKFDDALRLEKAYFGEWDVFRVSRISVDVC